MTLVQRIARITRRLRQRALTGVELSWIELRVRRKLYLKGYRRLRTKTLTSLLLVRKALQDRYNEIQEGRDDVD